MTFWFTLKKIALLGLNPVALALEFALTGLLLLLLQARRDRLTGDSGRSRPWRGWLGYGSIGIGSLVLYLSSIDPVAGTLASSLEKQYPPLPADIAITPAPAFLVVLAGGHQNSPGRPVLSRLNSAGLARIVAAVDLWKQYPTSVMIVTGHPLETSAMRAVAERLGVASDHLVEETESRDTADHPHFVGPLIGDAPFLLITSATHFPRAMHHFHRAGLSPTAAPVDFLVWPDTSRPELYQPFPWFPRPENLQLSATAWHEYLGLLWGSLQE